MHYCVAALDDTRTSLSQFTERCSGFAHPSMSYIPLLTLLSGMSESVFDVT